MPKEKEDFSEEVIAGEEKNIEEYEEKNVEKYEEEILKVRVTGCSCLNVRSRPSLSSEILFEVPSGTILDVEQENDEWFCITMPGEPLKTGCVMRKYTEVV
jgi:hypothetical protein